MTISTQPVIGPYHDNLFAVEELVMFRHITLIRAKDAATAVEIAASNPPSRSLQKHLTTVTTRIDQITTDSQIVDLMRQTESPEQTLEAFSVHRESWLRGLIVDKPC